MRAVTRRTWQAAIERAETARTAAATARTAADRIKEALDPGPARDAADRLAATWSKEPPR